VVNAYRRTAKRYREPSELSQPSKNASERKAETEKHHLPVVNAYIAEGINSKIMVIKRRGDGYRNRQNFKTAIYFYCGGLNLYAQ
jgi:hypothetical protein